uniref:Uncharacterized protein n=1 Tax=viral metagenome TaxID=1070528 RepID=A0A6M3LK45_9ZZZZ
MLRLDDRLVLTHPEEPPNYARTEVDTKGLIDKWLQEWDVPKGYWVYWRNYNIIVDPKYPVPAACDAASNTMWLNPAWGNTGVLAHEFAHESYSLLSDYGKVDFHAIYAPLRDTNPLIKFLYSNNPYGLTSDVEGHAEVYRYLGSRMPEELKEYYPKLIY